MRVLFRFTPRKLVALVLLAVLTIAAAPAQSAPAAGETSSLEQAAQAASRLPPASQSTRRAAVPEDRYAMAGGCYAVQSVATGGYVARDGQTLTAGASTADSGEPFRFQATDLGEYLLYGADKDFLAASEGQLGRAVKEVTTRPEAQAARGVAGHNTDRVVEGVTDGPANDASGRGARVEMANRPKKLADWRVNRAKDGTFRFMLPVLDKELSVDDAGTLTLAGGAVERERFALRRVDGCARFPEVQVNVNGPVATGDTPYEEVLGYNDAHLHSMAFEFLGGRARCGRPWHRYGVQYALRGCREHEIAGGRAAVLENVLAGRDMAQGHDTNSGWPTFKDWPKPEALTYEQVYYKWLERSWRAGLRMYTNLLVDNNQLCKLYPYKKHGCNEMDGVRLQYKRIQQFQDYIDAQSGGPGEGWFRIVTDPFEARRVMNAGKLAVVLGIEVSVLFDCQTIRGQATCTREQLDERLDEVYAMGVRQMELVNKFDNALSGVTGDSGVQGPLVNFANFMETGSFWQMRSCPDEDEQARDKTQPNVGDDSGAPDEMAGRDSLVGVVLSEFGATGAAPAYGPGPHCSQLGLSPLGAYLIERMMDKGMIFDPDHMSARGRDQALDIIEEAGYSGVVSSHSWADDTIYPRIWEAGGVVAPHAGSSTSFVDKWRTQKAWADDRYLFGLGFGSDMNGFSNQGQERGAGAPNPVVYPFRGLAGVTVDKQVSGRKTFDINVDGVAHFGMYPDFIEDVRRLAGEDGDELVADMARGAEAFLQMWERGVGVAENSCRPDVEDLQSTSAIQIGMTPEQVLLAAGQPAQREEETFVYCVEGEAVTAVFGPAGVVTALERTAPEGGTPADPPADRKNSAPDRVDQAVAATSEAAGTARVVAAHNHRTHRHGPAEFVASIDTNTAVRSGILIVFLALVFGLLLGHRRNS